LLQAVREPFETSLFHSITKGTRGQFRPFIDCTCLNVCPKHIRLQGVRKWLVNGGGLVLTPPRYEEGWTKVTAPTAAASVLSSNIQQTNLIQKSVIIIRVFRNSPHTHHMAATTGWHLVTTCCIVRIMAGVKPRNSCRIIFKWLEILALPCEYIRGWVKWKP
jgi:hypothetical protein